MSFDNTPAADSIKRRSYAPTILGIWCKIYTREFLYARPIRTFSPYVLNYTSIHRSSPSDLSSQQPTQPWLGHICGNLNANVLQPNSSSVIARVGKSDISFHSIRNHPDSLAFIPQQTFNPRFDKYLTSSCSIPVCMQSSTLSSSLHKSYIVSRLEHSQLLPSQH